MNVSKKLLITLAIAASTASVSVNADWWTPWNGFGNSNGNGYGNGNGNGNGNGSGNGNGNSNCNNGDDDDESSAKLMDFGGQFSPGIISFCGRICRHLKAFLISESGAGAKTARQAARYGGENI